MKKPIFVVALVAIVVITMLRVAIADREFAQVIDEPVHIAAGFDWFESAPNRIDIEHPPLARVFAALPLRLNGVRSPSAEQQWVKRGNALLLYGGRYVHNLSLVRIGNLFFLALAIVVAALWTAHLAGDSAGILAALLTSSIPPLLGHSGVATTDAAAAATVPFALYALTRWLDEPARKRAMPVAFAIGIGLLSKFSFVLFFAAGAAIVIAVHRRRVPIVHIAAIFIGAVAILWAGYRFEFGTPSSVNRYAPAMAAEAFGGNGVAEWFVETVPVPAPTYVNGILAVKAHDRRGHQAYLFGETSESGWWYYFPVALLFKTPLGLIALTIAAFLARRSLEPALIALAILLVAMTASINIGIRHLLPIYVPMAVASAIWSTAARRRSVVIVLIAWIVANGILAHPDYLAWFNELAGHHPEKTLADSNLDWGQDILRLRRVCNDKHIGTLSVLIFTSADLDALGFPPRTPVDAETPAHGWVAISETPYAFAGGDFAWLRGQPYQRIGKSIRLYFLP
jgi:4-amino-4-deoxy-L-arabinose transferase-like glycosyltransferase